MESRFILGQQALTPDGAVYQIIWDEPYSEDFTPNEVVQGISGLAPENTVAGSTCIFNTEDADGYPVEWLFSYDGTNWALDRVVRGGSAGDGYKTVKVEFILSNVTSVNVTGAFTNPDGSVTAKDTIFSDNRKRSVLCASNGAPSFLTIIQTDCKFTASHGDIHIANDRIAAVYGDAVITIEPNSNPSNPSNPK